MMENKLQITILTEVVQSLEIEPVQCYMLPYSSYLDKVENIVEGISPWTISDTINSVHTDVTYIQPGILSEQSEQIVPLFQNLRVSSVISLGVIGPILKTPIGGQISTSLVPSLDVATLERHGLIGSESEVEAIVAILKERIKPVSGSIRPVISPVSPQLRTIDGIVKLTPLALKMTTIMFPATTSTLRRSLPIIEKASKFIGAGIGVYRVISIFRR